MDELLEAAALDNVCPAICMNEGCEYRAENDPHGEHDFGSFELGGRKFFW